MPSYLYGSQGWMCGWYSYKLCKYGFVSGLWMVDKVVFAMQMGLFYVQLLMFLNTIWFAVEIQYVYIWMWFCWGWMSKWYSYKWCKFDILVGFISPLFWIRIHGVFLTIHGIPQWSYELKHISLFLVFRFYFMLGSSENVSLIRGM